MNWRRTTSGRITTELAAKKWTHWEVEQHGLVVTCLTIDQCTNANEVARIVKHFKPGWHSLEPTCVSYANGMQPLIVLNLFWAKP